MSKLNTTEISAKDFKAKLDTMTRNATEIEGSPRVK